MKHNQNIDDLNYSVCDFIVQFPEIAHLKSAKDFKYLITNKKNLDIYGFKFDDQLLGKTVFDLSDHMQHKWPTNFADKIHKEDLEVIRTKKPVSFSPEPFLNKDGYVITHSFIKTPLLDKRHNVTTLLTLVFNNTKNVSLDFLFTKYKDMYDGKHIANIKFLEYFNIHVDKFVPTSREIEVLLSLSKHKNIKKSARFLDISPRTFETHLRNIKLKLSIVDISCILDHFYGSEFKKF